MATPPDFTAGQILTAAQMNAVGMWLIETKTVPSSTASLTFTNCFSNDYNNYRFIFDIDSCTGLTPIEIQLRTGSTTTVTNYKAFLWSPFASFTSGAPVSVTTTTSFIGTFGHPTAISGSCDVIGPFIAGPTTCYGNYATDANAGFTGGIQTDSTSYVSAVINITGQTISGGKISVYGYND